MKKEKNINSELQLFKVANELRKNIDATEYEKNFKLKEISTATIRNWEKNGTVDLSNKLKSRANKRLSEKRFIPKEYIKYTSIIKLAYHYYDLGYTIDEIIFSIALNLIKNISNNFLNKELEKWNISDNRVINEFLKIDCKGDVLGGVYQSLLTEGEKNKKGSYYTPDHIVTKQINDFFTDGKNVIDPCCGTGQYLINIPSSDPTKIWGADLDEMAVKIARLNLMIKYKNINFKPNIFHIDSLENPSPLLPENFFDIVLSNPPWGAKINKKYNGYSITSGESFSYFIEKGLNLLKEGGILSYILPEAILNVKTHEDIRKIILKYNILSIYELGRIFTGVFTPVIRIDIKKQEKDGNINIYSNNKNYLIDKKIFKENLIFSIHISKEDNDIIKKVYSKKNIFLNNDNADWALGIVTGNNKKFISEIQKDGYIPVYTGKEVHEYVLGKPKKYLLYEPEKFQQIASIDKYKAKPKLIYKFISKKLVFSLDTEGVFTLNSANIVIPKINYPIKVITALFNSELYQMIFKKKFNSIKVLKSHIQELPLPIFDSNTYNFIEKLFDDVITGKKQKGELDTYIFSLLAN